MSRPTWGQTLSGQRISIGENRIVEMFADDANCLIPDGWTKLAPWFSVAWASTAIAHLPFTWVLVGTLALLFALRLYRELQEPP